MELLVSKQMLVTTVSYFLQLLLCTTSVCQEVVEQYMPIVVDLSEKCDFPACSDKEQRCLSKEERTRTFLEHILQSDHQPIDLPVGHPSK